MATSRPWKELALSTSARRLNVRARSFCTSRSPTPDGHSSSEDLSSALSTDAEIGWPRSASSSAGATTCSKLMVPYFSSAVSQASAAAGHHRPEYAHRDLAAGVAVEVLDRGRARPAPEPAYGHHGVGLRQVDDDGRDAAEVGARGPHDVQRDARGHARVDGVAALLEDAVARRRGERCDGRPAARRCRCHDSPPSVVGGATSTAAPR